MSEKTRYRVTILRASGSVWVEDYLDIETIIEDLPQLIEEYPHFVISKQRIVMKDDENEWQRPWVCA